MRRWLLGGLLLCSLVAGVPAASAGGFDELVTGEPDVGLTVTNDRLAPSEVGQFTVTVSNAGTVRKRGPEPFVERVTTARNVELTVLDSRLDAPIRVTSGPVVLGSVADGHPATASFSYETGRALRPGTYRVPIRVTYDYTSVVSYDVVDRPPGYDDVTYVDSTRRRIEYVTLVVDEHSQFALSADAPTLVAGDTGTVRLTVHNTGTAPARDPRIRLTAAPSALFFGDVDSPQSTTSVAVPELTPGASASAALTVGVRSASAAGTYPINARVVYEDENGIETESDPLTVGVRTRSERRFALRNVRPTTARVGDDDVVVSGTVVNRGPATAHDAVVTMRLRDASAGPSRAANDTPSIRITDAESSAGTLAPGDSRPVRFRVAIPRGVEPGDRVFAYDVEYENGDGDLRRTRTAIRRPLAVAPEVDRFAVRGVETNVSIDASNSVVLAVRNTANVTYRDVTVRLTPEPPFSSVSPDAYAGTLAPGETARLRYELSVADDAVPSTHGVRATVVAEEPDGDTYRSDPRPIRVAVRRQRFFEQDWAGVLVGGVAVVCVLGVGSLLVDRL